MTSSRCASLGAKAGAARHLQARRVAAVVRERFVESLEKLRARTADSWVVLDRVDHTAERYATLTAPLKASGRASMDSAKVRDTRGRKKSQKRGPLGSGRRSGPSVSSRSSSVWDNPERSHCAPLPTPVWRRRNLDKGRARAGKTDTWRKSNEYLVVRKAAQDGAGGVIDEVEIGEEPGRVGEVEHQVRVAALVREGGMAREDGDVVVEHRAIEDRHRDQELQRVAPMLALDDAVDEQQRQRLEDEGVERFDRDRETLFEWISRDSVGVIRWPIDSERPGEGVVALLHHLVEDEPVGLERGGDDDEEGDQADGNFVARRQGQSGGACLITRCNQAGSGGGHQYTPGTMRWGTRWR